MCKPIEPPQVFSRKTDIYIFVIGHIYYNYELCWKKLFMCMHCMPGFLGYGPRLVLKNV